MNFNVVVWCNRIALFVVYFWFGLLKTIGISPATGLVGDLAHVTLPFLDAGQFIVFFGVFEVILGLLWLFPKYTKLAFWLMVFHLITTFLPTVFLPEVAWNQIFTPSLVGQYIIKNLVILASGLTLYYFVYGEKENKIA
ncbi:MAG: hypothetical protein IPH28_21250 [Cytophagaceae bacterium]|nr:hypothetical protein [Cytophagaceae bacterium]MBK9933558.1 hypothetical protein [Cytophagaceae bacterium]MBL0302729.1 hypothetical protein [Cytophagaceae bacterium]MBL0325552.1 hypothetical protein [Cytophagaceae bacterium]